MSVLRATGKCMIGTFSYVHANEINSSRSRLVPTSPYNLKLIVPVGKYNMFTWTLRGVQKYTPPQNEALIYTVLAIVYLHKDDENILPITLFNQLASITYRYTKLLVTLLVTCTYMYTCTCVPLLGHSPTEYALFSLLLESGYAWMKVEPDIYIWM